MEPKTLRNDVVELKLLPHDVLKPIQGALKDLTKENFERMKGQMLDLGFSEPFTVWLRDGEYNIINGHQRALVIGELIKEGYDVPLLPCVIIRAKDETEARKKVLALTSQYGQITDQGLYEFMSTSQIDFKYIENNFYFPEIKFRSFDETFFKELEPVSDESLEEKAKASKVFTCPDCGREFQVN